MLAAFTSLLMSATATLFICAYVLFTFANPILSNSLDVEVYEKCDDAFRGRFSALCNFSDDMIGFVMLLACQHFLVGSDSKYFYLISIPFILMTLVIVIKCRTWLLPTRDVVGKA